MNEVKIDFIHFTFIFSYFIQSIDQYQVAITNS